MATLLLCAALAADFEFEEVSHQNPEYRAVLKAIDLASQEAIANAPHELIAMRQLAADETGDFRRRSFSRIRLYEHRLAELKAGRRVFYPRLPMSLKVGDVGILPGPMTVARRVVAESYLVEADWGLPAHNLNGLPIDAKPRGRSARIQFVYKLGVSSNNSEPLGVGCEFDMQNSMQRVVGVWDGLAVIEDASMPEAWMLEMLADYRRELQMESTPVAARRSIMLLSK